MLTKLQGMLKIIEAFGLFKAVNFVVNRKFKINRVVKLPGVLHPIHLRPGTSDDDVLTQIFVSNEYNIDLGIVPAVIIDGGANIGLATIFFKNKFPAAKIIAIEPDHDNVETLKLNLGKYHDVYIKEAALWSKNIKTRVSDKRGMGKWSLITEEYTEEHNSNDTVNSITINEIMNEYHLEFIDLLKIDIESAEKELFSENYMSWLPKTKVIIIELHDWLKDGCSRAVFTAINTAFKNYSYGQVGENIIVINKDLVDYPLKGFNTNIK